MKKRLLIVCGLFLMGCCSFFLHSANAAAPGPDFLGSELSHAEFVAAAKQLPNIQLTKDQLREVLSGPITVGDRKWVANIPDRDALEAALKDEFQIEYTCNGGDSPLETDVFEIDAKGIIRRVIQIIGADGGEDEDGLYENQASVLLETLLTDDERLSPLLRHYQYSMTFEQRSKAIKEAKPDAQKELDQEQEKAVTITSRLIKDPKQRDVYLAAIPEIIRQGSEFPFGQLSE